MDAHRKVVARAARLVGVAHGTAQLATTTFVGVITTSAAVGLSTTSADVTFAATVAGVAGILSMGAMVLWPGAGPSRRWTLVGFLTTAAAFALVAVAPDITVLYLGMALAPAATLAITSVRGAVARSFHSSRLTRTRDGTFAADARAWSLCTMMVILALAGAVVWLVPDTGWRLAAASLAVWTLAQGVVLSRLDIYDAKHRAPVGSRWMIWEMLLRGELRRSLLALGCAVAVLQLVHLSLEPHLATADRFGSQAAVLFGGTVFVARAFAIPVIRDHGPLTDRERRRSAAFASRWLLLAGLVAMAAVLIGPAPIELLVWIVVSLTLMEFGVGPLNDTARTYAARIRHTADSMATLSQLIGFELGALLAWLVQQPDITRQLGANSWTLSVCLWVALAGVAVALTGRSQYRGGDPLVTVGAGDGKPIAIKVRLLDDTMRLGAEVDLRGTRAIAEMPANSRVQVEGATFDGGEPTEIVICVIKLWTLWRSRSSRQHGPLFPGARFPLIADGRVIGWGRWRIRPGRWWIEDGWTYLESDGLARPLAARVDRHSP